MANSMQRICDAVEFLTLHIAMKSLLKNYNCKHLQCLFSNVVHVINCGMIISCSYNPESIVHLIQDKSFAYPPLLILSGACTVNH